MPFILLCCVLIHLVQILQQASTTHLPEPCTSAPPDDCKECHSTRQSTRSSADDSQSVTQPKNVPPASKPPSPRDVVARASRAAEEKQAAWPLTHPKQQAQRGSPSAVQEGTECGDAEESDKDTTSDDDDQGQQNTLPDSAEWGLGVERDKDCEQEQQTPFLDGTELGFDLEENGDDTETDAENGTATPKATPPSQARPKRLQTSQTWPI